MALKLKLGGSAVASILLVLLFLIPSIMATEQYQLLEGVYVTGDLNIWYDGTVDETTIDNVFNELSLDHNEPLDTDYVELYSQMVSRVRLIMNVENHRGKDVHLAVTMSIWTLSDNNDWVEEKRTGDSHWVSRHTAEDIKIIGNMDDYDWSIGEYHRVIITLRCYERDAPSDMKMTYIFYIYLYTGGTPGPIEETTPEPELQSESFLERLIRWWKRFLGLN